MIVKTRRYFPLALAVVFMVMSAGQALAQDPQPTPSPRTVNLSLMFVDRSNQSLDDIQKEEVRLFENNAPQVILSFARSEKPVDYGIAIDTSGSLRPIFPTVLAAVRVFIENQKPDDECFIERFISSDKIETVQEFTSDKATLLKQVSSLVVEGGQSAVVDGVYVAIQHLAERPANPERRRALVLFTDGEDRASYYSQEQLIQLLRANSVQVFVIGLVNELDDAAGFTRPSVQQRARDLLKRIALESGGRVFFPGKKKELSEALGEIFHDLHSQYEITYQSTDSTTENFHPLRVEVIESPARQKVKVITRPGYYLTPPQQESKDNKKKPKKA
jgi:Ca-activated chloride channel homolog